MLPLIPHDKANHAIYGSVAFSLGALASQFLGFDPLIWGFAAASTVAIAKEVYDRVSKRGTPDGMDALATVAGAIPSAVLVWVLVAP